MVLHFAYFKIFSSISVTNGAIMDLRCKVDIIVAKHNTIEPVFSKACKQHFDIVLTTLWLIKLMDKSCIFCRKFYICETDIAQR